MLLCQRLLMTKAFVTVESLSLQVAETQQGWVAREAPIVWMQGIRSIRFHRWRRMRFLKRSVRQPEKWLKRPSKKGNMHEMHAKNSCAVLESTLDL